MDADKGKTIDVEALIKSKNPVLLKVLPCFIIRYIKRVIHQDEINMVLTKYHEHYGVDFVNSTLHELGFTYQVEGIENIPSDNGRYIVIANHPLGGLDGLILMSEMSKHFKKIKFIVNDLLMNLPNLAPIFLPVNKFGKQNADYARLIEEEYKSESQILTFPAGLCSRKIKGQIIDLEWKKNFLDKAIRYQRDIIPVYVDGKNSNFFYTLSNVRKSLGIKANIEMFYLPDEMFNQKSKTIILKFGKPIPWQKFDKKYRLSEWAEKLKRHVYSLKNNPNIPFQE